MADESLQSHHLTPRSISTPQDRNPLPASHRFDTMSHACTWLSPNIIQDMDCQRFDQKQR
jgi:hypothetical protein